MDPHSRQMFLIRTGLDAVFFPNEDLLDPDLDLDPGFAVTLKLLFSFFFFFKFFDLFFIMEKQKIFTLYPAIKIFIQIELTMHVNKSPIHLVRVRQSF
jgi:hypothetical protein